mgnify:CR=1 FL=1
MSFKTPILCDRRVYDKKGKWKSPNNDIEENIYYFVKEPLTIASEYRNGREEMVETMTITIFGGKPIVKEDTITLEDKTKFKVVGFTINYIESNVLLKDMLKPRIESMDLILE